MRRLWRFLKGFAYECWWHLSGQQRALEFEIIEQTLSPKLPLNCKHCGRPLPHMKVETRTACICGEWKPHMLHVGCQCIAAQPTCTKSKDFRVVVVEERNG